MPPGESLQITNFVQPDVCKNTSGHTDRESSSGHTDRKHSSGHTDLQSASGLTDCKTAPGHTDCESTSGHTVRESTSSCMYKGRAMQLAKNLLLQYVSC